MMPQKPIMSREIKDVFYLIALQGLNYIAPLLVLPYLMKVLGAEKFGYIGFSLSVMQYLMLVVDFGFNFSVTKKIALVKNDRAKLNDAFTSTVYAKLILLSISFIILLAITLIPRFEIYRQTMFIMFLMVIGNAFSFVWLFQGLGQIRFISVFNIIAKLSILPLTFIFVKSQNDYLTAAFLQSFVSLFTAIITVAFIIRKKMASITLFIKENVITELKDGYPIFLSFIATTVYTASFVIVLGYFSTSEQVGQYSAVDRIMRALCWLVFIPVTQAFYPKVVQLGLDNKLLATKLVKKILIFVSVCMLGVFTGMFFFSPYIVEFLGKDYQDSLLLFKIMAFVPIFVGIGGIMAQLAILALGDELDKKKYQRAYFIAAGIALICIFTLIPYRNAIGAAISLLITEICVCGLMFIYGYRILYCKK